MSERFTLSVLKPTTKKFIRSGSHRRPGGTAFGGRSAKYGVSQGSNTFSRAIMSISGPLVSTTSTVS